MSLKFTSTITEEEVHCLIGDDDRLADDSDSDESLLGNDDDKDDEEEKKKIDDDDDDDSSIDESYEVLSLVSSIEDRQSCRGSLQKAVHSLPFQIVILLLVILDALIVLFELLLDVGALDNIDCKGSLIEEQARYCHYNFDTRPDCRPTPFLILNQTNVTEGNGTGFCQCGYRGGRTVCIPHVKIKSSSSFEAMFHKGINPAIILHLVSLGILTLFLIELVVKFVAFRLKFFTHRFEVFDAIVVTVSWLLDIVSFVREESFAQVATLIILLRIWRVVRIVNGGVLWSHVRSENQFEKARESAKKVIHALHKAQKKLEIEKIAYNELKSIMESNSLPVPAKPNTAKYPHDDEEGIS